MECDVIRFCYTFDLRNLAALTFLELVTTISWDFKAQFDSLPDSCVLTDGCSDDLFDQGSLEYCWLFRLVDEVLLGLADLQDVHHSEDNDQGDGLLKCRGTKTRSSNLNEVRIGACEVITCSHPPHYPHRPWPWISLPQENVDGPPASHPRTSWGPGPFKSNLPSSEAISSNHGTYSVVVEPNSPRAIPILSPLGVRRRPLGQDRFGRRNGAQTSNLIYLVGRRCLPKPVLAPSGIGHFSTTQVRYPNFPALPPLVTSFQSSCHRKRIQPLTWLGDNDLPTPDQN
ncbi:uncharacterized protein LOC131883579 [Tigriopus californicus]|uniref:uncharacterized protein LOC131883579 n=1 Tax=Tigriopus californicus TaxID=6832 RepID=UPI0027DA1BE0|nr:uncharacterized protein LOC131883579 [Tigriopus californicus]